MHYQQFVLKNKSPVNNQVVYVQLLQILFYDVFHAKKNFKIRFD
jgi:hypothetical protein